MNLLRKYIIMFRQDMKQAMSRRCGLDELNYFILIVSFLCIIFALFTHKWIWLLLGAVVSVLFCIRIFSKKLDKRNQENSFYLKYMGGMVKIIQYGKLCIQMKIKTVKDTQYAYFICKTCKQIIRVPKGRNKVNIRCPKCNSTFIKRT